MKTTFKSRLTAEQSFKLQLIAQNQEASPKVHDIDEPIVSLYKPVSLDEFMTACAEFFSPALGEIPDHEHEPYMQWVTHNAVYLAKRMCRASQVAVGEVFGLSQGQVKAIEKKMERKAVRLAEKGDDSMILMLAAFRHYLLDLGTIFC